jgi:DNA-binding GntR family transcriptional regulator
MKAVEKAYSAVRAAIFAGEYPPGSRITEQEIVERVGVSRTPVREALRRLQSEGVVTAEPNHGVVVTAFSKEEADQIFELRALLESYCARLAADRISRAELKHVRKLAEQQLAEASKRRRNLDRISALNAEFHATLFRASGNRRLATILVSLIEPTLVLRTFHYYSSDALLRSAHQHLELVDLLEAHDVDGAEALMKNHVLAARHEYRRNA